MFKMSSLMRLRIIDNEIYLCEYASKTANYLKIQTKSSKPVLWSRNHKEPKVLVGAGAVMCVIFTSIPVPKIIYSIHNKLCLIQIYIFYSKQYFGFDKFFTPDLDTDLDPGSDISLKAYFGPFSLNQF